MNTLMMVSITLRLLELHVAGLTSLGIIRVSSLSKILLSRDSEYELLVTFTA
jgi:hypothetical protein